MHLHCAHVGDTDSSGLTQKIMPNTSSAATPAGGRFRMQQVAGAPEHALTSC
jgi:hypothetical protein